MSSVLPSSAEDLERTLETVMGRLLEVPTGVNAHTDADQCPEDLLPFLAWYLSVDTWNSSWSVEEKREAIRNSVTVHSRKGTRAAVKLGLLTLDLTSEIVESMMDRVERCRANVNLDTMEPRIKWVGGGAKAN